MYMRARHPDLSPVVLPSYRIYGATTSSPSLSKFTHRTPKKRKRWNEASIYNKTKENTAHRHPKRTGNEPQTKPERTLNEPSKNQSAKPSAPNPRPPHL